MQEFVIEGERSEGQMGVECAGKVACLPRGRALVGGRADNVQLRVETSRWVVSG